MDLGHSLAWLSGTVNLASCIYVWFAHVLSQRLIARELAAHREATQLWVDHLKRDNQDAN